MTLTTAQLLSISKLIDYLRGSPAMPLDSRVSETLVKIFAGNCGFRCGCGSQGPALADKLRDEPIRTLLQMIECVGGGAALVEGTPIPPVPLPPVNLSDATLVLAHETVTNTGGSFVFGDLALSPGTAVTGFPPGVVSGTQNVANTAAANEQLALTAEYNHLAGLAATATVAGDIGGQTLTPGVYKSTSTLLVQTADLTLDAQGDPNAVFVFQVASALTVANSRQILLTGGAKARNVFWQVGSSATLGTGASFKGTICAQVSITAQTGAVIEGRLLARTGAVSLDTNILAAPAL